MSVVHAGVSAFRVSLAVAGAAALLALLPGHSVAVTPPTLPPVHAVVGSADDRAAIAAMVAAESDAWNSGDAKAFSARFAEDGFFTNVIGMRLYNRPDFERQHARIFATLYKGSHNTLEISRVKFVRPDVAVVNVESTVTGFQELPPGLKARPDGSLHTALQMLMVKESDGWWISSFHNVAISPVLPPVVKP